METDKHDLQLDLVLLVDDDDTTNYLNQRTLHKANVARQIDVVKNGEEALAYLSSASTEAGHHLPPDLIFLDIKMSVMDGFEFLEEYQRLRPEQKARTLIMLSSSASFYDLHRLEQYPDVARHIAKPLTVAHLQEIMQQYFGVSSSEAALE